MGYKVVIGMEIAQRFQTGDVVPDNTAINGDFCHTIIPCVGQAPKQLRHDEPSCETSYDFWKNFLRQSKGLQRLAKEIERGGRQIIFLDLKVLREIIAQIKREIPKISEQDCRDRAEWLVFWTDESIKRYGSNAAIGLF